MLQRRHIALFVLLAVLLAIMVISLYSISSPPLAVIDFYKDGTLVSRREGLDLVEGSNITITEVDDPSNDRVRYTIASTGGGVAVDAKEDDAVVVTGATAFDFQTGFDVALEGTEADVTLDTTELNSLTWGDNSLASILWTLDPTGATNPIWTYTDGTVNLSTGTLQQGSTNVVLETRTLTGGTGIAAIGDLSSDRTITFSATEINSRTWGDNSQASILWTFDPTGANPVITFTDGVINISTGEIREANSPLLSVADQDADTDITADLEEETHASEHAIGAGDEVVFYGRVQDEGSNLTQRRIINFVGAGVSCADDAADSTDCTIAGGGGSQDLQDTYDLEVAPAQITLTDALGGVIFEGDAETTDPSFTVIDSTVGKIGILIDNDDEAVDEASPILRIANSTSTAGDTQYDLMVNSAGTFLIRGDDGIADLSLNSSGSFTLSNGLTVLGGSINFPAQTVAVSDFATSGIWAYAGDFSGAANITGAWTVDATGSIDFASGADLLVAGVRIDYNDLNRTDPIFTTANSITFGDGGATQVFITFETTLEPDGRILFDGETDNRFEINKPLEVAGALTESGVNVLNATDEGLADADLFATCDTTSDNLVDSTCIEQGSGTDISADLEEELHDTEHADGGDDELFSEREAIYYISGDVTVGVKPIRIVLRRAVTYKDMICSVNTTGTTSAIDVNIQENGTDIFSDANRVSIAAGSNSDISGAPTDTTGAVNDVLRIIVDNADSGDTGTNLTCQFRIRHPVDSSG